jgi:hypothetical protein
MRQKSPAATARLLAVLRLHAADQMRRSGASGRPYLSAESCTHLAAGKSGSDSHRPKPSAMPKDPTPSAARADSKQRGREGRGRPRGESVRLLALLLVLEGKLVRLVVAFRSVLPAPPSFRCSGSGLAIGWCCRVGSFFFPSILSFINHYFRNKFHETFFLNLSQA